MLWFWPNLGMSAHGWQHTVQKLFQFLSFLDECLSECKNQNEPSIASGDITDKYYWQQVCYLPGWEL